MIDRLKKFWQENPLMIILLLAAVIRFLAAIFSKGYAMSDDHFVVIHNAQRWLDGYKNWFADDHPSGFSLVYPGLHYILFYLLKLAGIVNPEIKMLIVRFLHALYSLITVYFGYQITLRLSNRETANIAGLLLEFAVDAVIATNTTLSRDAVAGHPLAKEAGGLSGATAHGP